MIETPRVTIEDVTAVRGNGEGLVDLAERAVDRLAGRSPTERLAGVIAATFSNPQRFPALSVRLAARLGLGPETPAFDVQMACSAYPYALYLAGRLAADTGGRVLVVNGDVQSPLVDPSDHATGGIFSDAVTATVVSASDEDTSEFAFLSRYDTALTCAAEGPIRMDGMKVFTFVATEVRQFLQDFVARTVRHPADLFVPHQANPYMVRQLSRSLGLTDRLVALPDEMKNPGSCSIPLALAHLAEDPASRGRLLGARALLAGFGAGYSAAAASVRIDLTR